MVRCQCRSGPARILSVFYACPSPAYLPVLSTVAPRVLYIGADRCKWDRMAVVSGFQQIAFRTSYKCSMPLGCIPSYFYCFLLFRLSTKELTYHCTILAWIWEIA